MHSSVPAMGSPQGGRRDSPGGGVKPVGAVKLLRWDGCQDGLTANASLPSWGGEQAGHPSCETAQIPGTGPCRGGQSGDIPSHHPAPAGLLPAAPWGSPLHANRLQPLCLPSPAISQSFTPKVCARLPCSASRNPGPARPQLPVSGGAQGRTPGELGRERSGTHSDAAAGGGGRWEGQRGSPQKDNEVAEPRRTGVWGQGREDGEGARPEQHEEARHFLRSPPAPSWEGTAAAPGPPGPPAHFSRQRSSAWTAVIDWRGTCECVQIDPC